MTNIQLMLRLSAIDNDLDVLRELLSIAEELQEERDIIQKELYRRGCIIK